MKYEIDMLIFIGMVVLSLLAIDIQAIPQKIANTVSRQVQKAEKQPIVRAVDVLYGLFPMVKVDGPNPWVLKKNNDSLLSFYSFDIAMSGDESKLSYVSDAFTVAIWLDEKEISKTDEYQDDILKAIVWIPGNTIQEQIKKIADVNISYFKKHYPFINLALQDNSAEVAKIIQQLKIELHIKENSMSDVLDTIDRYRIGIKERERVEDKVVKKNSASQGGASLAF